MIEISAEKMAEFKAIVEKEWPWDEMIQEIQLIRLIHQEQTKGMTNQEKADFYNRATLPKTDAA